MTEGTLREGEQVLLARARAGDEEAFGVLIAPYLRELHVHCYRMLGSFLATVPAGGDLAAIRLVPTQANAQPAVAAYLRDGATARAYGIMVLTVREALIGEITGFADSSLFPLFSLPQQTDWPPGQDG